MDWWNISLFGIIPIFTVVLIFFVKRKLLWTAPLISTIISVIISIVAMQDILIESEYRALFGVSMLIHLAIVVLLTMIAYLVAHIIRKGAAHGRA